MCNSSGIVQIAQRRKGPQAGREQWIPAHQRMHVDRAPARSSPRHADDDRSDTGRSSPSAECQGHGHACNWYSCGGVSPAR
jgi:hypothetical protein